MNMAVRQADNFARIEQIRQEQQQIFIEMQKAQAAQQAQGQEEVPTEGETPETPAEEPTTGGADLLAKLQADLAMSEQRIANLSQGKSETEGVKQAPVTPQSPETPQAPVAPPPVQAPPVEAPPEQAPIEQKKNAPETPAEGPQEDLKAKKTGESTKSTGNSDLINGDARSKPMSEPERKAMAEAWVDKLSSDPELNLTRDQAKGVVGNFMLECGMESGRKQDRSGAVIIGEPDSNMADDNENGYSMAQWGGVRKQGLIDFAEKEGFAASSQGAAFGFMKQELLGSENGSLKALQQATTPTEAATAFSTNYLRPSEPHLDQRIAFANSL